MGTIGNTATPSSGWNETSSRHQVAGSFTNSTGGSITLTALHGYFDGAAGSITAQLVVWDSSGAIIWQSGNFSVAQGSTGAGDQDWHTKSIPSGSQPVIANGASIFIGWWADAEHVFSIEGSGKWNAVSGSSSAPGSFAGSTQPGSPFAQGGLGAYADYTTGGGGGGGGGGTGNFKIRRSGAWSTPSWKIRRSGAWATPTWKIRRSGAWTTIA